MVGKVIVTSAAGTTVNETAALLGGGAR
jgi:hypothetical protein